MLIQYAYEPNLDEETFKGLQEALDNDDKNALTKFFADKNPIQIKNFRWHILLSLESDYINKLAVYDDTKNNKQKEIHICSQSIKNMSIQQIIKICQSKAIARVDKKSSAGLQERLCFGAITEYEDKKNLGREVISALINATFKNKNFDLSTTESYVQSFGSQSQIDLLNELETEQRLKEEQAEVENQKTFNEIKNRVSNTTQKAKSSQM